MSTSFQSQTAGPAVIDDLTATSLYNEFDTATTERQEEIRPQLLAYADERDRQQGLVNQQHHRRAYTDDDYLEELTRNEAVQKAMQFSPSPDSVKYIALNRAFLENIMGRSLSEVELDAARSVYARDILKIKKDGPVSDEELYTLNREFFKTEDRKTEAGRKIYSDTVAQYMEDAANGSPFDSTTVFRNWRGQYGDLIDERDEARYLDHILRLSRQASSDLGELAEPAGQAWLLLTRFTQGQATHEEVLNFSKTLGHLGREERDRLYGYIAMAADARQIDRGAIEQLAKNMGESVSRGFDFIPKGALHTQERSVLFAIQTAKEGLFQIREEDGQPILQAGTIYEGKPGYRKPTEEEKESLARKYEAMLPVLQIARELKAIARTQVDPIRPLAQEGTLLRTVELGTYALAGSVGTMTVMAIPGYGMFAGGLAIAEEEYDNLRIENPKLDPTAAWNIASVSAAGQAVFEKLQVSTLLGRLPMTGRLIGDMKPGLKRWAVTTALSIGEQNIQEGAQDLVSMFVPAIAAAIREDMPDKDFRVILGDWANQRGEVFFAVLPLALVGGRIANFRDFKDGGRFMLNPEALGYGGFSPEQVRHILSAANLDEAQTRFQEEYGKRTPENIAKGVVKLSAMQKEAQSFQDDPSMPVFESREVGGSREYVVINPDGTEFVTKNEEVAQMAYLEAVRDAEQARFLKSEENANSEAATLETAQNNEAENLLGKVFNPVEGLQFSDATDLDQRTSELLSGVQSELERRPGLLGEASRERPLVAKRARDLHNVPAGVASSEFIAGFEKLTGKKIVWVDNEGDPHFAAIVDKSSPNHIFLHVKGGRAIPALIGHEWGHTLAAQDPELYQELQDKLIPLVNDWNKQSGALSDEGYRQEIRDEELTNNIIGDAFAHPEFWKQVAEKDQTLFERIVASVRKWFDALINRAKNSEWGTESFVSDLEAAHKAVMATFSKAIEKGPYSTVKGAPDAELASMTSPVLSLANAQTKHLSSTRVTPEEKITFSIQRSEDVSADISKVALTELISFYETQAKVEGRNVVFQLNETSKTVEMFLAENPLKVEEVAERMRIAGLEGVNPSSARILGETSLEKLRDDVNRAVIRLYEGALPGTVVEEVVEGRVRDAIARGQIAVDWLRSEVEAYQQASGEQLLTGTDESVIEAVSTLGEAYFAGKVKEGDLPRPLMQMLRELAEFFRGVFARGLQLQQAIKNGQVSKRFETFLKESTNLGKPNDPILSPTGHEDWAAFTDWDEWKSKGRVKAMPIRVLAGVQMERHRGYGLEHIRQEHGQDIRNFSGGLEKFVHRILLSFNEAYLQSNGRILLFSRKPTALAIVELRPEKGGYYSVVSAYPKGNPSWIPAGEKIIGGRREAFARNEFMPGNKTYTKYSWEYLKRLSQNPLK